MIRPKAPHNLTKEQFAAKLVKDSEYEIAVQNLSAEFYLKKRTGEAVDGQAYTTAKIALWKQYLSWAELEGLYEEVALADELIEAEAVLAAQIEQVNRLRTTLGQPTIRIQEQ